MVPYIRPIICCIDGNIGAGKSTILNNLGEKGYLVFEEDLNNWGNLLNLFYEDPKRWMCTFQIKILTSMNSQYQRILDYNYHNYLFFPYIFVERSPRSSTIFIKTGVDNGYLNAEEQSLIDDVYSKLSWKPDINFYVNTDCDTCFDRVRSRNRACEKEVSLEYLTTIHEKYTQMYENDHTSYIIDGLPSVDNIVKQILNHLHIQPLNNLKY